MKPLPRPRQIVPSVLSASFAHLARDVRTVQEAGAKSVQIDVMDGHFVPNITVGPIVIESLRKETTIFLDVHLMIENPLMYATEFAKAGADLLTLHYEACADPLEAIQAVKKLGVRVGMAIRPKTSVDVLYPLLEGAGSRFGDDGRAGIWRPGVYAGNARESALSSSTIRPFRGDANSGGWRHQRANRAFGGSSRRGLDGGRQRGVRRSRRAPGLPRSCKL